MCVGGEWKFLLVLRPCDFLSLSHGNIILGNESVSTQKHLPRKRNQVPCQGLERESLAPLPI